MGMRFRKSVSLGKGARINLSKSGVGGSFGTKGARYSVHSSGRRTTSAGIPGSGLYYVSSKGGGSKSGSRSIRASSELTEAQQRQLTERYEKKLQLIKERRDKPLQKLRELYAAGKVDKAAFEKLAQRDSEITEDLVILGRGAAVKLAERYVTGKLSDSEFKKLKNELLADSEAEKKKIIEGYKAVARGVSDFVEKAKAQKSDTNCNYCGKPKKFFSPLVKESDFKLCISCKMKYSKIRKYEGDAGQFYTAEKATIDPDTKNSLVMSVLPQHILEYR